MRLGNAVCARLGKQEVYVASRARRTCRQQYRLVVGLSGNDLRTFTTTDHLSGRLLWFKQAGKRNIQRHAKRPQRFEARVTVA